MLLTKSNAIYMNKPLFSFFLFAALCLNHSASAATDDPLRFDPTRYTEQTLQLPNGESIRYRAYEQLYYVTNIEDKAFQFLNIYIPESATADSPIFLRTYVGGYMAATARTPSTRDASARALQQGYVLCIAGSRGWNSTVEVDGQKRHTGRAPAAILDLKAAVRYLRHNDDVMAGNAEHIITDGTSAGGAMSSLLGSSGNSELFAKQLKAMGAADERDDVFAAVCFCPIIDLEHADMAYEWLYGCTNDKVRKLSVEQKAISNDLAKQFPAYINSLQLKDTYGKLITSEKYLGHIKHYIKQSAQKAVDNGVEIPSNIGITVRNGKVAEIDMPTYLNYVATTRELKTPPSFDAQGFLNNRPTPENQLFGDEQGSAVNFTTYGTSHSGGKIDAELQLRINMMNPMYHLHSASDKAPHWYIRHGARDRDTAFSVPVNLATKLQNMGYDTDFELAWDRGHEGDYDLDQLFDWINKVVNDSK